MNFFVPENFFDIKNYFNISCNISYPITIPYIFSNNKNKKIKKSKKITNNKHEIIIMIGFPGSGKSFIVKKYIKKNKDYNCIDQDILKTKNKCFKKCNELMINNKNIIVDNTNIDIKTRSQYISLANKNNYLCRCIYMTASADIAYHNNCYRAYHSKKSKLIPRIAYRFMFKKFKNPTIDEGFYKITKIDWIPDKTMINTNYYNNYFF